MVRKINKINRQDQYRPRSKIYIWMRIYSQTRRQDEEQGAVTAGRPKDYQLYTPLLQTVYANTHTHIYFLYCEANSWEMILCVWCVSSKSSTELQLLLSSTCFAVLPLRMENEPQKALIICTWLRSGVPMSIKTLGKCKTKFAGQ